MVMVLVWNDVKSFKQHLEDMRIFCQTHHNDLEGRFAPLKDMMPTPCDIHPPGKTGGTRGVIRIRGEPSLVPIYEVELLRNSQN